MDIRPIRTKADHRAALKEVERLWNADPGTPDGERVDVLVTLIEAYEAKHVPIAAPGPIAAIEFMMEQKGLSRRDLEPAIGSRGRVSEILTCKRPLALPMVRALSALLHIPTDVLARPYETARQPEKSRLSAGRASCGTPFRLSPMTIGDASERAPLRGAPSVSSLSRPHQPE